jgi:hypothetical protein
MTEPITCCIKYKIAPERLREFEHYAQVWKGIIERLGGSYQGCFIPGNEPPDASYFSFPEIGQKGPDDTATVIFSFRDLAAYERYRREASNDPECEGVTDFLNETKCFTSYERTFVKKIGL